MATKKKNKKRYRLKSSFKRFLVYLLVFIFLIIYGSKETSKALKEIEYHKTYEYRIMQVGYTKEETRTLIDKLTEEELDDILSKKYNEIYPSIVSQKYFLSKNYHKYLEYKEYHEKTSYEDVIAIINVHANIGWYNETYTTNPNDNYLILVNKFYKLDESYNRDDIENIPLQFAYANNKAASIVIEAFQEMKNDIAKELDVHLMINSSYRSFKEQEELYNSFKAVSLKYADSYAARPGYSEHQTALAIDITSLEHKMVNEFTESAEYEWLKNNCYKYGFILRYPEGKEYLTGYNNESWHFRYVGKEAAKIIYDDNITFDEYYAYYIEK